ncbi:MAG TPA: MFS transporter [Gammaproteobacteria bacterium]|nr:MFS transporter [Gammaproteobacteria bacterium]
MNTGLKPWIVVFSAALFFFYEFIQMNMISSLAPYLMHDFSIDATKLGNLSATYFYSTILFLLPAGQILDRFSTRKVILTALLICTLGTYCFAVTDQYELAELSRLLTGIGSAFCFLSCIRLASRWFHNDKLALVSGLVVTMAMLGGTIAQTPLTLLINALGNWRHAIMIDAGLGLVFWILIFFLVQDYPKDSHRTIDNDQEALENYGYWHAMKTSYGTVRNWLCGLYTCFMNLPIFLIGGGGFGSLYLQQVKHLSLLQSSYPPMMIFFGTVIGSPLSGWISDKLALRRLPMQIGAVLAIILMFIFINISATLSVYAIMFFLLGLVGGAQIISYPTVAESNPRIITATSVSVVSFTTLAGGAVFQPLFGYVMDKMGDVKIINNIHTYSPRDYHVAMMIMPAAMLVALFVTFFIRETHCKSVD